jgi:hypothetical protein
MIQFFWNVLREVKMEAPIQPEYFRSGGATTYRKKKNESVRATENENEEGKESPLFYL